MALYLTFCVHCNTFVILQKLSLLLLIFHNQRSCLIQLIQMGLIQIMMKRVAQQVLDTKTPAQTRHKHDSFINGLSKVYVISRCGLHIAK